MSIIDQNSNTVEQQQRIFDPALHLQRYNVVAALTQRLICKATSLLDVGSSTCEFGKFVLSPLDLESSLLHHYHALDIYRGSLGTGSLRLDQELRSSTSMKCWLPRRASLYCGSVFDMGAPDAALCPSLPKSPTSSSSSSCCLGAPHAECIVSLDVVEHIPLKLKLHDDYGDDDQVVDGPAAFLDWVFHTAPCPRCTRAIIVTTPNQADNVPVLKMKPGEMRHYDHKFEWDLGEFAAATRQSLCRSSRSSSSSSFCAGAWLHFGVGETASQGVMVLQRELLERTLQRHQAQEDESGGDNLLLLTMSKLWKMHISSSSSSDYSLLFARAQEQFAQQTVFGKLLSFEVVVPHGEESVLVPACEKTKRNGAEVVDQLNFSCVPSCRSNGAIDVGSGNVLWTALYELVLRAARRVKQERRMVVPILDASNDEDEDIDQPQPVEGQQPPALVWGAATAVSNNDDDQDEDEGEEEEQEAEEDASMRIPFSEIASSLSVTQELQSIPLSALFFYFSDNETALPNSIMKLLMSHPSSLRLAQHLRRVLGSSSSSSSVAQPHSVGEPDWWMPAAGDDCAGSAQVLSQTLDQALSQQQREELLWAAVDGFFDGAAVEDGDEKVVCI